MIFILILCCAFARASITNMYDEDIDLEAPDFDRGFNFLHGWEVSEADFEKVWDVSEKGKYWMKVWKMLMLG